MVAQSMLVGLLMICLEAHEDHHVGTLIVALNPGTCMEMHRPYGNHSARDLQHEACINMHIRPQIMYRA